MISSASAPILGPPEDRAMAKFFFTPQEAAFLAFAGKLIQSHLEKRAKLMFLNTGLLMQLRFNNWAKENIIDMPFSAAELDLATIISSIWSKTKDHIEGLLNKSNKFCYIENERFAQLKADEATKKLDLQGFVGQVFTLRQACFLLDAANWIGA